jgi:hypothetical protein
MFTHPFALMLAAPSAQAITQTCTDRIIQEIVTGLESPCGTPRRDRKSPANTVYFTYSDDGWNGPRYSPLENCGFDSPDGLGNLRIKFQPLKSGDCKILEIKDWPRENEPKYSEYPER